MTRNISVLYERRIRFSTRKLDLVSLTQMHYCSTRFDEHESCIVLTGKLLLYKGKTAVQTSTDVHVE